MENKRQQLEKLKIRLEKLKPITRKSFETSKQLQKHVKENMQSYEEAKDIQEQIQQLEYELMTPNEQKEYDEYRRLSKLKAEGKLNL